MILAISSGAAGTPRIERPVTTGNGDVASTGAFAGADAGATPSLGTDTFQLSNDAAVGTGAFAGADASATLSLGTDTFQPSRDARVAHPFENAHGFSGSFEHPMAGGVPYPVANWEDHSVTTTVDDVTVKVIVNHVVSGSGGASAPTGSQTTIVKHEKIVTVRDSMFGISTTVLVNPEQQSTTDLSADDAQKLASQGEAGDTMTTTLEDKRTTTQTTYATTMPTGRESDQSGTLIAGIRFISEQQVDTFHKTIGETNAVTSPDVSGSADPNAPTSNSAATSQSAASFESTPSPKPSDAVVQLAENTASQLISEPNLLKALAGGKFSPNFANPLFYDVDSAAESDLALPSAGYSPLVEAVGFVSSYTPMAKPNALLL